MIDATISRVRMRDLTASVISLLAVVCDGFVHGREESVHARAVAPILCELARARAVLAAETWVAGETPQRLGRGVDVTRGDEDAVLAVVQEVVGGTDLVGENERQPAGGGLVDDDRPGLALGEEREDVGGHVDLDDPLPLSISREHDADVADSGEIFE